MPVAKFRTNLLFYLNHCSSFIVYPLKKLPWLGCQNLIQYSSAKHSVLNGGGIFAVRNAPPQPNTFRTPAMEYLLKKKQEERQKAAADKKSILDHLPDRKFAKSIFGRKEIEISEEKEVVPEEIIIPEMNMSSELNFSTKNDPVKIPVLNKDVIITDSIPEKPPNRLTSVMNKPITPAPDIYLTKEIKRKKEKMTSTTIAATTEVYSRRWIIPFTCIFLVFCSIYVDLMI